MELSNKEWKTTKKVCLNKNSTMDHYSNIVWGWYKDYGVHFEFSHPGTYYEFTTDNLYWLHRFDTIGFTRDFIVEYSSEFLPYFPDVQPPNNSLIKYKEKAKHNLLLSFKSSTS